MRNDTILCFLLTLALAALPVTGFSDSKLETSMTHTAQGPFEVKLAPLDAYNQSPEAKIGRRAIDKQFHGALEASSQGEMLSGGGEIPGSAAYVAIERVTGTLDGRHGSFTLIHDATMDRGKPALHIKVVPDSGTGELAGLAGSMDIQIAADGAHTYVFTYTLAPKP